MENISDLKQYINERIDIRINDFGYQNTRITRLSLKRLKGFIKQIDNSKLTPERFELKVIIQKEIEFRELCLSLKSVFKIKIK
jgi:hypothetical protein